MIKIMLIIKYHIIVACFSKNKIKRLLMKDALNPKIIEEGLELYDFDYEFDEALKMANKLCSSIKDRSLKLKN